MVAVLLKREKKGDWEFICYCKTQEDGWVMGAHVEQQERFVLFNRDARTIVVDRAKFDNGEIAEVLPPDGWVSGLRPDDEVEAYARSQVDTDED